MPFQQLPAPGDRVGVPWYVDVLEGVVVRTYDTGSGPQAVVSVQMPGAGDESPPQMVTVPVSHLCWSPAEPRLVGHARSAVEEPRRESRLAGMTGIADLDLTGFTATGHDSVWQNAAGVSIRVDFQEVRQPGRQQQDPESLLHDAVVGLLTSGAVPMEYWIESRSLPALFVMYKRTVDGGRGWAYSAEIRVLRAACSLTIQMQAAEQAKDRGLRESFVLHRFPGIRYIPRGMLDIKTPDGRPIEHDYVDSHEVDSMFPDHPLTQLRAALRQIIPSVHFEEWFLALPSYPGSPSPQEGGPRA